MLKGSLVLAINASFMLLVQGLLASNTVTQTVTFSIEAISEIAVSGDPPPLNAVAAQPGTNPSDVTDMTTFYAITSNGCSEKVSASLNSPMPTGTELIVEMDAPDGATCLGNISLGTSCQNCVCGISQVAQSNLQICYVFQSTMAAGILPPTTRIVTFTLAP